jgi:hypothetical protein
LPVRLQGKLRINILPRRVTSNLLYKTSYAKLRNIRYSVKCDLDKLVRISGRKTSDISARLTIMETKRMERNTRGGIYKNINYGFDNR